MDERFEAEDELRQRQGMALYPLGRALRSTFDADNHDTLGSDVTGLMLDLTRVPFEPCARDAPPAAPSPSSSPSSSPPPPPPQGLLGRMRGLLRR